MRKLCLFMFFLLLFVALATPYALAAQTNENEAIQPREHILEGAPQAQAQAAILYEATTGTVLYQKNEKEALPPASVTKVMTLLLVAEAIQAGKISLDDKVIISENAASMGGSQVFLKEGEQMSVEELLKCTVIASANDASVALAEHVAGSEEAFVKRMNDRSKELSLLGCNFENTTGLDDTVTNHTMSAEAIAQLSAMLIQYDFITKYSSLWQDTIRNGEFTLTNTNRLVRYYEGCNGLKTGSTDKAGYCITVSAKRGNLSLICVIMGADSKECRNEAARALLDFGFASVALYHSPMARLEEVPVYRSEVKSVYICEQGFSFLCQKGSDKRIEKVYEIPEHLVAPFEAGENVGRVVYLLDGKEIGEAKITAETEAKRLSYLKMLRFVLMSISTGDNLSKK